MSLCPTNVVSDSSNVDTDFLEQYVFRIISLDPENVSPNGPALDNERAPPPHFSTPII